MRDWGDEPYVKLYTNENADWRAMPWEARTVLLHALHGKFDRAGFLDLGRLGLRSLASILQLPEELVAKGVAYLLEQDECWKMVQRDGHPWLYWPNYLPAQSARATDRLRQQQHRERDRAAAAAALAKSQPITLTSRSDQISLEEILPAHPGVGTPPPPPEEKGKGKEKPRGPSVKEECYAWAMQQRALKTDTMDQRPSAATINTQLQPVIEALGVPGFKASWRLYLADRGYPMTEAKPPWPWGLYIKQWGRYRPAATPPLGPKSTGGFRDVGDADPYKEDP